MKIVTVEQMQAIEKSADEQGLSYDSMMHNAGHGIANWVVENLSLANGVVGLVGSGNNGGDTMIALTWLAKLGVRSIAYLVKDRGNDPLITTFYEQGGQVVDISQNQHLDLLQTSIRPGTIVLDGILGTGLRLPLRGVLKEVMGSIREVLISRPGVPVIAVDCPSGTDCDSGEVSNVTFTAEHTLCMAALKKGLLEYPGRAYAGKLHLIEIGITDLDKMITDPLPEMITEKDVRKVLPNRPVHGHKGTFGTCQVIAGTEAFTGAAYLTGAAAYRAGCGLVDIATHKSVQQSLAGQLIEAVWTILPDFEAGYLPDDVDLLEEHLQQADSIVIGPGFGMAESTRGFIDRLVRKLPHECPVLFDADGLKLLSQLGHWWEYLPDTAILTPHPGEMAVLSGLSVDEIQSNRWNVAKAYAKRWNVVLILKGAQTVIAVPNGDLYINPVGDPSLATAGSGDVLAGIIGGLLAQGASSEGASIAGVWLHSQAGLAAKQALGTNVSVMARDILDKLSNVFLLFNQ
jgi:ADP-dependent NAD(P)H-hydrate dehydratase / NAD(P)H-hydrate epimerase